MKANFAYKNSRDFEFILQEWLPLDRVFGYDQFKEYYSKEDVGDVFAPILRMCKEIVEPVNEEGINHPSEFVDGKVVSPKGLGDIYHMVQSEGWGTSNLDDSKDAMVLPRILYYMIWEMLGAANCSLITYVFLTDGALGLIQNYGDDYVKDLFLSKMMDGTWTGTMCLTEPSAGSDVGDIKSKAYPTSHPRVFKIKGSKLFITGGDNDFTENIVHLCLARVDGARPGTKGISLFVVPKHWVDEDGRLEPNDVVTTGIEHKMGLVASTTASLSFGDGDGCRGWLLGRNPLENDGMGDGMSQMFRMMNDERIKTIVSVLSCLANGYYNARDYCAERVQGRPFTDPKGERVTIINHEDIRRTLLMGKAHIDAIRAMAYKGFYMIDVLERDPDPEERRKAQNLIEILTPINKAYPSDEVWWLLGEAIQAYGGYGYMKDYPLVHIVGDSKIYSIWEGTNYVQAMDLVGRKWTMGKGQAFAEFMQDIADFYEENKDSAAFEKEFAVFGDALKSYSSIVTSVKSFIRDGRAQMVPLYARRVMTATGQLYGGRLLLEQALIAERRAGEVGEGHYDYAFYRGKVESARFYLLNVVPNVANIAGVIANADTSAIDIPIEAFDY